MPTLARTCSPAARPEISRIDRRVGLEKSLKLLAHIAIFGADNSGRGRSLAGTEWIPDRQSPVANLKRNRNFPA